MPAIVQSPQRQKIIYFCDETSYVRGDEFMAVGGIAVNAASANDIEIKIEDTREKLNLAGEIKWSKTKDRRDSGQKAYAELLRELVANKNIHLHIRFQRTQDWDHARSGPRGKIDTVSHAYYELLLHRPAALYGSVADIHVRPDKGDCTAHLHRYIGHLNTKARQECGVHCVRSIHTLESSASHFLQLLDVTLGGLAAVKNARHERAETSAHKRELALHIHALWDNFDLSKSHAKTTRSFNIWNAKPMK